MQTADPRRTLLLNAHFCTLHRPAAALEFTPASHCAKCIAAFVDDALAEQRQMAAARHSSAESLLDVLLHFAMLVLAGQLSPLRLANVTAYTCSVTERRHAEAPFSKVNPKNRMTDWFPSQIGSIANLEKLLPDGAAAAHPYGKRHLTGRVVIYPTRVLIAGLRVQRG